MRKPKDVGDLMGIDQIVDENSSGHAAKRTPVSGASLRVSAVSSDQCCSLLV
jgi:hypothetical protein